MEVKLQQGVDDEPPEWAHMLMESPLVIPADKVCIVIIFIFTVIVNEEEYSKPS